MNSRPFYRNVNHNESFQRQPVFLVQIRHRIQQYTDIPFVVAGVILSSVGIIGNYAIHGSLNLLEVVALILGLVFLFEAFSLLITLSTSNNNHFEEGGLACLSTVRYFYIHICFDWSNHWFHYNNPAPSQSICCR